MKKPTIFTVSTTIKKGSEINVLLGLLLINKVI